MKLKSTEKLNTHIAIFDNLRFTLQHPWYISEVFLKKFVPFKKKKKKLFHLYKKTPQNTQLSLILVLLHQGQGLEPAKKDL